jgi:hypothetical protein
MAFQKELRTKLSSHHWRQRFKGLGPASSQCGKKGRKLSRAHHLIRYIVEPKQNHHQKSNMSTQTTTSEYMLLFRGAHWDKDLSPEEIQKIMGQWNAWFERLTLQGKVKSAHPLEREGKSVSGKGRTIADGPFAESKEAIAGYFLLELDDFNEALEIAKECPTLDYGVTVEVRPVAEQCRHMQRVNEQLLHATA